MAEEATQDTILDTPDTSWKEGLPEELQEAPYVSEAKDLSSFVKSAIDTKKMVGAKGLTVPTKDSAPEEWEGVWNSLGRPEQADGYELPADGLPEGMELDKEQFGDWFKEFHEIGLNKQQAASLVRKLANQATEIQQSQALESEQERNEAMKVLKMSLGKGYDEGIAIAKSLIHEGGEEVEAFFQENGNNAAVINWLVKLGKDIGQDEVIGRGRNAAFVSSPAEANAKIAEKQRDPEFMKAYTTQHHPAHDEAVREMTELFEHARPA